MRFNNKISFWKEQKTQQPDGSFATEKALLLETWANVEQLQVSKDIEQAEQSLPLVFRVAIRKRPNFAPKVDMIVEFQDNEYRIINTPHLNDVMRNRVLTFDIK